MCFYVDLLLRGKEHDRIIVSNDPVNGVDPWGLDWRWPDNRPPRIKPDKRKKKFWDKCDKSCKIDRANEYAHCKLEAAGWAIHNLLDMPAPIPGDPRVTAPQYLHWKKSHPNGNVGQFWSRGMKKPFKGSNN